MMIMGGMLIGLGIGMAFDNAGPGVLIGLGLGMVLEGIVGKSGKGFPFEGFPFGKPKSKE